MTIKQQFTKSLINELADDKAVDLLANVFAKVLASQVVLDEADRVTVAKSFSTLAKIFAFVATPAAERKAGLLQLDEAAFNSALSRAAQEHGLSLDAIEAPVVTPSYTLTVSAPTVDEGASVTFTVKATDLPADTSHLAYSLSGIQADDLQEPAMTGHFILDEQGVGSVTFTLAEDELTEGPESLTLTLQDATQIQASVLVKDTSLTPTKVVFNPPPTGDGQVVSSYAIQQKVTSGYQSNYNYTQDYRVDALLAGAMWGYGSGQGVELTYSFPGNGSLWATNYGTGEPFNGFIDFNELQKAGVRAALDQWSEVANVYFVEVEETADQVGDLRFAFSGEVTGSTLGWAYTPGINYTYSGQNLESYRVTPESGDVWLNSSNYYDTSWLQGSDNYHTLAHEVGHSLGLKHPFEAEGNGALLTGSEDSYLNTIMSYSGHSDMGYSYTAKENGAYSWVDLVPSSPMLYDILAIQHLYGMNLETRTGDDVYSFSADTPFMQTIWDAGGTDTLDASNQDYAVTLNLNEGAYSSVGVRYMDFNTPSAAVNNLVIAFGTQIENAIGTVFDDSFIGNDLDNVFFGQGGSDKVDGGGGKNTFVLAGNYADYSVSGSSSSAQIIDGNDTVQLTGIDYIQFADQLYTFA